MARDLPDSAQHAGKQPRVEREEPVPVGSPEDPDLIEVNLTLQYKASFAPAEIADAIKKASDTPPYASHSTPRASLPLNY